MAVSDTARTGPNIFVRIMVFVLILAVIIGIGLFLYRKLLPKTTSLTFPPQTFISKVEPRTYIDKDGKKITYYVINTQNTSNQDFYSCTFVTVARGTLTKYQGFLSDYQLKNCNTAGVEVKPNYECRLDNAMKKYFKYQPAITLRKFTRQNSHEIPVASFYLSQTRSAESFLTQNQLSDTFEYQITCNTSDGQTGLHTQRL